MHNSLYAAHDCPWNTNYMTFVKICRLMLSLSLTDEAQLAKMTPEARNALKEKIKQEKLARKEEMKKLWEIEKQRRKEERDQVSVQIITWRILFGAVAIACLL